MLNGSVKIKNLSAWHENKQALHNLNMEVNSQEVLTIIGPSGSGKSTFIRCLNRLHELTPGNRASGEVFIGGEPIYGDEVSPFAVREKTGMVFPQSGLFPAMNVFENVAIGLRLMGKYSEADIGEKIEDCLKLVGLWSEVKDKLSSTVQSLAKEQRQRLSVARALSTEPPVILMDEPAGALDPGATAKFEELVRDLRKYVTVIIVTHNMQQAARISDLTGFFLSGRLVEFGKTSDMFTNPRDIRTEQYITGRFV